MEEIVTSDLGRFGARERAIAVELLQAWNRDGLPADFEGPSEGWEVRPMFNTHSGYVFLDNGEGCQTAVMEDGKLVSFYCLGYGGIEGTLAELKEEFARDGENWHSEDVERFNDIENFWIQNFWQENA